MPGFHIKEVSTDAVGTTINSPETVGTIAPEGQKGENIRILGLINRAINTGTVTSAEALLGKFIYSGAAYDLVDYEVPAGLNYGAAPATNIAPMEVRETFQPLMKQGNFVESDITIKYDAVQPEPTPEVLGQSFLVYDSGEMPQELVDKWLDFGIRGVAPTHQICRTGNDDEIGDTDGEVLDNSVTMDSKYNYLVAVQTEFAPDALLTDNEMAGGDLELSANISGIGPLKIPLPAYHGELGTKVGAPLMAQPLITPIWVDKSGINMTMNAAANLVQVTSGAFAAQYGVFGRV